MPDVDTTAGVVSAGERAAAISGKHIRGSSLLLSGRGLALCIKLITQLLLVRYFSTAAYGSWAYALAAVTLLGGFSSLSLDRALARFATIYHEHKEYGRFFGALLLVAGAVLISGLLFAAALYSFPDSARALMGGRGEPHALLFILIFLVPLEGLDQLCVTAFATLGRAGAIFFRKYLLGPLLQLSAVLLLVALDGDLLFMAAAYLGATLIGGAVNAGLLVRLLRHDGLLQHFRVKTVELPARAMFAFALPLMTGDWLEILIQSSGALLLGYLAGPEQVALFRVVIPLALVSQVVTRSFDLLYVPAASRLFAVGDRAGVHALYGRTAFWVAVTGFPLFAITFAAATPVTVLLYGPRYEASGTVLAILAVGAYAKCAIGFSTATLKVLGRVRYLAVSNLLSAGLNLALNLILIPRFGIIGAAAAMSGTLCADALIKHEGLRRATGLSLWQGTLRRPYANLAMVAFAVVLFRLTGISDPAMLGGAAVAATLAVLLVSRSTLGIREVFPELARVPLVRMVLR